MSTVSMNARIRTQSGSFGGCLLSQEHAHVHECGDKTGIEPALRPSQGRVLNRYTTRLIRLVNIAPSTPGRIRTCDLLLRRQLLSIRTELRRRSQYGKRESNSQSPVPKTGVFPARLFPYVVRVPPAGFEPAACCVGGSRSHSGLSYGGIQFGLRCVAAGFSLRIHPSNSAGYVPESFMQRKVRESNPPIPRVGEIRLSRPAQHTDIWQPSVLPSLSALVLRSWNFNVTVHLQEILS
jgi:hypothetical protein